MSSARKMAGKQTKPVMGIENFVRGAHKRDEYEMPNNFMTDFREIVGEGCVIIFVCDRSTGS